MKRQATDQPFRSSKKIATEPPPPKPDSQQPEPSAAALQRELALAQQSFKDQNKALSDLNIEARAHEDLIWRQNHELVNLRKTYYTACEDFAKILADANGSLHHKVAELKDYRAHHESELRAARRLFEKFIPSEKQLKRENEFLKDKMMEMESRERQAKEAIWGLEAQMTGRNRALRQKVQEVDVLKAQLAEGNWQLQQQVVGGRGR